MVHTENCLYVIADKLRYGADQSSCYLQMPDNIRWKSSVEF
jgi:hypothetical protein